MTIADDAIWMAQTYGVPVFPCFGKIPVAGLKWKEMASQDPDDIRRTFTRSDATHIGMPTGQASGLVVIDIDIKDGAQGGAWLDAHALAIPATLMAQTQSGGVHLYFRAPAMLRNSAGKIAPGVDVRGDGGYVIVPPSPGYIWIAHDDVAPLPEWIYEAASVTPQTIIVQPVHRTILDGGSPYALAGLEAECANIRNAPDGAKHFAINKAAYSIGGLVASGDLDHSVAWGELSAAVGDILIRCRDQRHALKTLETAYRDGGGRPRAAAVAQPNDFNDIDLSPFLAKTVAKKPQPPAPIGSNLLDVGGVIGMLVEECNKTAIRPQPFLALGAAICAVGVLAGRKYRTRTDLRTNIYIAAIAESGAGKDHAPEVVRRAFSEAGLDRYMAGENIASGRAVLTSLGKHPARLFQIDELGLFLRTVTGRAAPGHRMEIWSELLKLYSRAKGSYGGTEYADQKENARVDLQQPHCCLYGMTTPSTFWAALEGGAMLDGSLARFLVFVTDNHRPTRNKNAGIIEPCSALLQDLKAIARGPLGHDFGGNLAETMVSTASITPYTVPCDDDADELHDNMLENEEDIWARKVAGSAAASIVARLGENAMKLALVRAVSDNPEAPAIGREAVQWGWDLAMHCTRGLLRDASAYMADNEHTKQANRIVEYLRRHGALTLRELYAKGIRIDLKQLRELLAQLVEVGYVTAQAAPPGPTGGRPTTKYVAVDQD